jgi:hypothetical protein
VETVMIKPVFAVALAIWVVRVEPATAEYLRTWTFGFEEASAGNLPDSFQAGMTGTWKATEWRVREFQGNRVLAHIGFWEEDPEGVYPVCWVKESAAEDLTLTVRLFPVRPPGDIPKAHHDGAGIVVRFKDPMNYYLLRAVPHEARVRLYKVVNGERSTLAGRNLEVGVDAWHELKLKAAGDALTAYFNGAELFTHRDPTFARAGAFGLWSKPNNVTYFDDLKAEIAK